MLGRYETGPNACPEECEECHEVFPAADYVDQYPLQWMGWGWVCEGCRHE